MTTKPHARPPCPGATLQRLLSTTSLVFANRTITPRIKAPPLRRELDSKSLPPAPSSPLSYEHDPAGFDSPSAPELLKRKLSTLLLRPSRSFKSCAPSSEKVKPLRSFPPVTEYEDEDDGKQTLSLQSIYITRQTSTITSSTADDTPWDTNTVPLIPLPSSAPTLSTISIPPSPAEPHGGQFKVQSVAPSSPKRRVSAAGASAAIPDYSSRGPWVMLSESVARAGRTRWAAAVICATSRRLEAPSGRHVSEILTALREGGVPSDRSTPVGAVFYTLQERLVSKCWVVALKATVVMHAILRAGNPKFVTYVAEFHSDLLESVAFGEAFVGGKEGRRRSRFVQGYIRYLEKWLRMRRNARFPIRTGETSCGNRFAKSRVMELLYVLPRLMDTLDAVQEAEAGKYLMDCDIVKVAIRLVFRDVKTLMVGLQAGFKRLTDIFFEMENRQTVPALALYTRFMRVVDMVRPVMKRLKGDERSLNSLVISEGLLKRMRTCVERKRRNVRDLQGNLSLLSYRPVIDSDPTKGEEKEDVSEEEHEDKDIEELCESECDDDDEESVFGFELERSGETKEDVFFTEFPDWSDTEEAKSMRALFLPHSSTPFPSNLIRSMKASK